MLVFVTEDDRRGIEVSKRLLNDGYYVSDNIKDIKYAKMIYLGLKGIDQQNRITHQNRICYIDEDVFKTFNENSYVFTIVENKILRELAFKNHFHYFSLMNDDHFLEMNTILTAEGLISFMIDKIESPLYHSRIMILGYGHCAKAVAERLSGFHAEITILARNTELKEEIEKKGYLYQAFEKADFNETDIIVNTIPYPILDKSILEKINNSIILFDIASFPYGIDHHEAIRLGFDSYIVAAIPSKYYPDYSAQCIVDFIKEKGDKFA
ncbi:MAG: NAD(P)-dependent oxidoreductase [Bacilli bacterium]|nr:NAD(P)-dependent oxidoreductase [Bacilli bacterium]